MTDPTSPVETIRRASALLRERAKAAHAAQHTARAILGEEDR